MCEVLVMCYYLDMTTTTTATSFGALIEGAYVALRDNRPGEAYEWFIVAADLAEELGSSTDAELAREDASRLQAWRVR